MTSVSASEDHLYTYSSVQGYLNALRILKLNLSSIENLIQRTGSNSEVPKYMPIKGPFLRKGGGRGARSILRI